MICVRKLLVSMRFQKIIFTEAQKAYIREHFPTGAASDIADVLKVSAPTVIKCAREMGLEKAEGWCTNNYHGRYVNNYSGRRKVA